MMVNTISPAPGDSPPSSTKGRADRMTLSVACSLSKIAHASGFVHLFLFGHCPTSQKRQRLVWLVVSFMKNDMFYGRSLSELCQIFRPRGPQVILTPASPKGMPYTRVRLAAVQPVRPHGERGDCERRRRVLLAVARLSVRRVDERAGQDVRKDAGSTLRRRRGVFGTFALLLGLGPNQLRDVVV